MRWSPDKAFVTELQALPPVPPVIPAIPYPTKQGTYNGCKWYATGLDAIEIDRLVNDFLLFLLECKAMIMMGKENEEIQDIAINITEGSSTNYDRVKAIHNWVYENIEYKREPIIVPPWELIKLNVAGDCKSFTTLTGSLLGAVGIPSFVKLVKVNGLDILHIYNLANLSWEAVDGTGELFPNEVKPVSAYILFQIDEPIDFPPKPLPDVGTIIIPEEEVHTLKNVVMIGALGGAIGLLIWSILN